MSDVTEQECQELADLARLSLTGPETQTFTPQIGRIVDYVEQLAAVDVTNVPEYSPDAPISTPLRADEPGARLTREQVLAQAPVTRGEYVAVPKFKED